VGEQLGRGPPLEADLDCEVGHRRSPPRKQRPAVADTATVAAVTGASTSSTGTSSSTSSGSITCSKLSDTGSQTRALAGVAGANPGGGRRRWWLRLGRGAAAGEAPSYDQRALRCGGCASRSVGLDRASLESMRHTLQAIVLDAKTSWRGASRARTSRMSTRRSTTPATAG
jgi:hypothetical protein